MNGGSLRREHRRVRAAGIRTRGRARIAAIVAAGLLVVALAAAGAVWLAGTSVTLADVEARLHRQDRFAEFVDRAAPGFTLARADGGPVGLDDFRGRIVILNFVYARCTDICPPHMAIVADLQERLSDLGLDERVELVTLATDTEDAAETAAIVRDYGERFGLERENWRMLYRGDRPARTVIELASEYGLEFQVVTASDGHDHAHASDPERQVHGAVIHVIDPSGRLRARFHGLRFEPETLTSYVQAIVDAELQ